MEARVEKDCVCCLQKALERLPVPSLHKRRHRHFYAISTGLECFAYSVPYTFLTRVARQAAQLCGFAVRSCNVSSPRFFCSTHKQKWGQCRQRRNTCKWAVRHKRRKRLFIGVHLFTSRTYLDWQDVPDAELSYFAHAPPPVLAKAICQVKKSHEDYQTWLQQQNKTDTKTHHTDDLIFISSTRM